MPNRLTIPILIALTCGPIAGLAGASQGDALEERLTTAAERAVNDFELGGLAVSVAVGDDAILMRGFGEVSAGELRIYDRPGASFTLTESLVASFARSWEQNRARRHTHHELVGGRLRRAHS